MANRSVGIAAAGACICLALLTGCASTSTSAATEASPKLATDEACSSLEGAMDRAGLEWPVADKPVTRHSADLVLQGFEDVAGRTDGDLRTTLDAWTSGFRFVAPYLVANDPHGAAAAANDVQQESLLLANTNLATFCRW